MKKNYNNNIVKLLTHTTCSRKTTLACAWCQNIIQNRGPLDNSGLRQIYCPYASNKIAYEL